MTHYLRHQDGRTYVEWDWLPRRQRPLMYFARERRWMHIHWGQVPCDYRAESMLGQALETSGINEWLRKLFHENEHRLHDDSALVGPGHGCWTYCPSDIGEKVVDIVATLIGQAMRKIIFENWDRTVDRLVAEANAAEDHFRSGS